MDVKEQASLAIKAGDAIAAIELLESGAEAGDPACWMELGFIFLQGRIIARDLSRSRESFGRAAALGDTKGRRIHTAMIANGTGGPSDMPEAIRLLKMAAGADPDACRQLAILNDMDLTPAGDPSLAPGMSQLDDRPWIASFPGLFSSEECAYLIEQAGPAFSPAPVGQRSTGSQGYSQVRTCEVAVFPWVAENPVIHALNRRIAAASQASVECGEPLQVLRYNPGQEFKPHVDCTASRENQRVLTMLVYLNEDYVGGETEFLATGRRYRGKTGDGLLFRNADLSSGRPDPDSSHAGLPVTSGCKLIASRWIRQKPYGPARNKRPDP